MKRSVFALPAFAIAFILIALSAPLGQTIAARIMTCADIDGQSYNLADYSESFRFDLNAGETIGGVGITVSNPAYDPKRDVFVEINSIAYTEGFQPFSWSYTIPSTGTYDILVEVTNGDGQYLSGSWTCGTGSVAAPSSAPVVSRPPEIHDNRENRFDLAAPVAVYDYTGFVDVYAVNPETSEGTLIIHYDLADLPQADGELHVLVTAANPFSGQPVGLYLLADGSLQVNTTTEDAKPYIYNWKTA
ncbi:MAG: hypothetical protein K8I60_10585 [Anaerolineae bacterium]|nr:hypothetical protein [Anaerolineae bacterium]